MAGKKPSINRTQLASSTATNEQPATTEQEQPFDQVMLSNLNLPKGPNRGIFWDVVCSIFEPGVNTGLMLVIHFIFSSLLLAQLIFIVTVDVKNVHMWMLLAISAALYASLIVFVQEVDNVRRNQNTGNSKKGQ